MTLEEEEAPLDVRTTGLAEKYRIMHIIKMKSSFFVLLTITSAAAQ
jgi:hypothetical protein